MGLTIIISVDRAASSGTSTTDVEISDLKVNIKILQAVNIFKKWFSDWLLDCPGYFMKYVRELSDIFE